MDVDAIVGGLDPDQYRAVTEPTRTLRILAGAGSGKTRVLTRRLAHRAATEDLDPQHALVLTFTRRAAFELRRRLGSLGLRDQPHAGTFHGVAYAQLRARWSDRRSSEPAFVDSRVRFLSRMLRGGPHDQQVPALADEIDWARARRIGPEGYVGAAEGRRARLSIPAETVAEVYEQYENEKRTRRSIDFDDVLEQCIGAINRDPAFADAQRWRFRHLFVDEFQDVNPLQFALLRAWMGGGDDLCVVGDPNQAIYGWNGAEASLLTDLETHLGRPLVTVHLRRNHRSSPEIVQLAPAALHPSARSSAVMFSDRPPGPSPQSMEIGDAAAECRALVDAIRRHHGPDGRWSDQAVLVRTNTLANELRIGLETAAIPVRVRDGGERGDDAFPPDALAHIRHAPELSVAAADMDMEAGIGADGDKMRELARLIRSFVALEPEGTASGFERWLRMAGKHDSGAGADGVDVLTFHAAKGLEWDMVHLCGLEAGFVPIAYARSRAELDEERRLLYVALTRARRAVRLSWTRSRAFRGVARIRKPSPYLEDLVAAIETPADSSRTDAPVVDLIDLRHSLRSRTAAASDDHRHDETLEVLRAWRQRAARTARVSPAGVLQDDVLARVARDRPADAKELAAIPGMGPLRANRLGGELLPLLHQAGSPDEEIDPASPG